MSNPANYASNRASVIHWLDADLVTGQTDGAALVSSSSLAGWSPAGGILYEAAGFQGKPAFYSNGTINGSLAVPGSTPLEATLNSAWADGQSYTLTFVAAFNNQSAKNTWLLLTGYNSEGQNVPTSILNNNGTIKRATTGPSCSNYPLGANQDGYIGFVLHYTYDATTGIESMYQGGQLVSQTTGTKPSYSPWSSFITLFQSGDHTDGKLMQFVVDNVALTSGQIADDAGGYWGGVKYGRQLLLSAVGNSRTLGVQDSSGSPNYVCAFPTLKQLKTLLDADSSLAYLALPVVYLNWGAGGTVATYASGIIQSIVNPLYRQIHIVLYGINNLIVHSQTGAEAFPMLQTLITGLQTYNAPIAMMTELDASAGDGGWQTFRNAYIALQLSTYSNIPGQFAIVRTDLDPDVGVFGASTNAAYFSQNLQIHPTGDDGAGNPIGPGGAHGSGGYGQIAWLLQPSVTPLISALFPPPGPPTDTPTITFSYITGHLEVTPLAASVGGETVNLALTPYGTPLTLSGGSYNDTTAFGGTPPTYYSWYSNSSGVGPIASASPFAVGGGGTGISPRLDIRL